jgi:hypothetical protein
LLTIAQPVAAPVALEVQPAGSELEPSKFWHVLGRMVQVFGEQVLPGAGVPTAQEPEKMTTQPPTAPSQQAVAGQFGSGVPPPQVPPALKMLPEAHEVP